MEQMKRTHIGPAAHLKTVHRLEREWKRSLKREEQSDDLATAWKLAAVSDRALARLRAAQNGLELSGPRTRRVIAREAFAWLGTIGKVIGGALRRAESLRRAQLGAALWRAARKVRKAVRRALTTIALAVMSRSADASVATRATHAFVRPCANGASSTPYALARRAVLVLFATVLFIAQLGGVS